MWLHSVLLVLTVMMCTPTFEARRHDFPLCDRCAKTAGDLGVEIQSILFPIEAVVRKVCRLNPKSEDLCVLAEEHVFSALRTVTETLFPRQSLNKSIELTCTHILRYCEDKSASGQAIPPGKWSCKMCEEGLNFLMELGEPLSKINKALPSIFCLRTDQECVDAFSDAIEVEGAIGDLIKKLRSPKAICQRTLECVE